MEITLSNGHSFLVDDEDWDLIKMFKWRIWNIKRRATPYVQAYARINGKRTTILLHRFLCGLESGDSVEVDHINHNGLDNRRDNLRIVTRQQNIMNMKKRSGKTTSKYKGVSFERRRGKWVAQIRLNGKQTFQGYFATEEGAARVYNARALEHFGEYAHPNEVSI